MKTGARRRRSKQTIKEDKRLDIQRQKEISEKMARIDQMEHQLAAFSHKQRQVESLDKDFQKLLNAGLLKIYASGNVDTVES